ncbi:KOW motif-containing protein [Yinghuangia seranimata]|uniref:KOW motif-containing protein n=1 Tax=Yinghuangia seranimata TaxID=408067 RepID=UPI00248B105D|nr:KOW motif-containing protein [Yinghuangia seranimata]MDI2130644.1 hypothetical protein [Yinghuangia seranimata]
MSSDTQIQVGDEVRVTEGPFADFTSPVTAFDVDRGRVRLIVDIFGDPTNVEVPVSTVVKIA